MQFAATGTVLEGTPTRAHTRLTPPTGVLRDRNDLQLLAGCADDIPDSLAHQKPCHRGYERNRAGLGVRLVLSDDMIFLYAPIVTPEGHRVPKGNSVT